LLVCDVLCYADGAMEDLPAASEMVYGAQSSG
jgi:hypothetical protein